MLAELRPHQLSALAGIKHSLGHGNRRVMLQAPTGAGKTILAAAIVDGARAKGNRVLFTVPAISLIDQTVRSFWDQEIRDVGVIQANHEMTDFSRPVQVASVQTLRRRIMPETDVVVIDEAHTWFKDYASWFENEWGNVPVIGLSATPWTKGLGKHYDDLIIAATTQELIDAGYLCDFKVYAPSHPDLSGVKIVAGDYHEGQLSEVMSDGGLIADVVQNWIAHGENRSTLCFGVDRAHAKKLQERFKAAGVPCGYQDAHTDRFEREKIRKAFHSGDLRVVCNVGTLTTGVDWDVRCLILARPTKSEMLFTQIIGRALRTAEGKDHALIFDHSDTHLRLGFVTEVGRDTLCDGSPPSKQQDRKKPMPKECSKCHFMRPAGVRECPSCGFVPEPVAATEHEGQLEELTKSKAVPIAEKQRWYSGLLGIAAERGYKPGWAYHKYREKFKVAPANSLDKRPADADLDIRSWVKSRQIAYAKAREAGHVAA